MRVSFLSLEFRGEEAAVLVGEMGCDVLTGQETRKKRG